MSPSTTDGEGTDQKFCLEQVLKVRPYFRLSHPYASPQYSKRALITNAWLSAVEESSSMVSDEVVTRTKLSWWHQSLFEDEPQSSTHPIIRQMVKQNLLNTDNRGLYQKILLAALEDLDSTAPVNESVLKSLCQTRGENQMKLELGSKPAKKSDLQYLEVLCAINGLAQLLRESERKKINRFNWIPLTVLARFNVTRSEMENEANTEKANLILAEISALPDQWLGNIEASGKMAAWLSGFEHKWRVQHLHFLVLSALNMRCIRKLHKQGQQQRNRILNRPGPSDALFAWRTARQITKRRR